MHALNTYMKNKFPSVTDSCLTAFHLLYSVNFEKNYILSVHDQNVKGKHKFLPA